MNRSRAFMYFMCMRTIDFCCGGALLGVDAGIGLQDSLALLGM